MRILRLVLYSMLALALLMAMSCSGGSPTVPPTNTGQGNGDIFPVDPVGPIDEIDPIPYPWWDCQRFFVYQGSISSWTDDGPHTIPLIINGNIRIRDKNCSADISKVRIRWGVKDLVGGVNDTPDWPRNLPGIKIKFNTGTLYLGRTYEEHNLLGGGYDISQRYVIWTYPAPPSDTDPQLAGDLIDGWYHYRKHKWMMISGGEIIHTNHHTHLNINQGHEVFIVEEDPGS